MGHFQYGISECSIVDPLRLPCTGVDMFTDRPNDKNRTGAGVFSATLDLKLKLPLGRYATVFQ